MNNNTSAPIFNRSLFSIISLFSRLTKRSVSLVVIAISSLVLAACTNIKSSPVYAEQNVAIEGYDAVAYFTKSQATEGKASISHQYNGVKWHFSSEKNRDLFAKSPEKYAPQYGGYCAYAMSNGFTVSTDPHAFTIVNDKLYLNYSLGVRETWLEDKEERIVDADANWLEKLK